MWSVNNNQMLWLFNSGKVKITCSPSGHNVQLTASNRWFFSQHSGSIHFLYTVYGSTESTGTKTTRNKKHFDHLIKICVLFADGTKPCRKATVKSFRLKNTLSWAFIPQCLAPSSDFKNPSHQSTALELRTELKPNFKEPNWTEKWVKTGSDEIKQNKNPNNQSAVSSKTNWKTKTKPRHHTDRDGALIKTCSRWG